MNERLWMKYLDPLKYLHTDGEVKVLTQHHLPFVDTFLHCENNKRELFLCRGKERSCFLFPTLAARWRAEREKQFWLLAPFRSTLPGAVEPDRIGRLTFQASARQEVQTCRSYGDAAAVLHTLHLC